ncbi:hypothetical protein DF186_26040, partial [Enterococcus hirae]
TGLRLQLARAPPAQQWRDGTGQAGRGTELSGRSVPEKREPDGVAALLRCARHGRRDPGPELVSRGTSALRGGLPFP